MPWFCAIFSIEEIDVKLEFDVDVEDVAVQAIDGVVISNDDELIRLLFYYIKPGENPDNGDNIQCKAVAEFRISRARFLEIARSVKEKAKELNMYQKRFQDFMFA